VGDHLGQVYEKQGKRQAAIHAYRLALAALSLPPQQAGAAEEVRKHLERLGVSSAKPRFGLLP
jgi:hypothetical protein